jgi:hypothetical protein
MQRAGNLLPALLDLLGGVQVRELTRTATHRLGRGNSTRSRALVSLLKNASLCLIVPSLLRLRNPVLLRLLCRLVGLDPLRLLRRSHSPLRARLQALLQVPRHVLIRWLLSFSKPLDIHLRDGGRIAFAFLTRHLHGDLVGATSVGGLLAVKVEGALGMDGLLRIARSCGSCDLATTPGVIDEVESFLLLLLVKVGLESALEVERLIKESRRIRGNGRTTRASR